MLTVLIVMLNITTVTARLHEPAYGQLIKARSVHPSEGHVPQLLMVSPLRTRHQLGWF